MSSTQLVVALDETDLDRAEDIAAAVSGVAYGLKVGLTLFAAAGAESLARIGKYGPVFCDLKFHDIPAQVQTAAAELAAQGVWMFTVHASGGPSMVRAAVEGAQTGGSAIVAGVTVLTSLSAEDLGRIGQGNDPAAQALLLGKLAVEAGAQALVCSGRELPAFRSEFPGTTLVVPGVRPPSSSAHDQARIVTPAEASARGADYVVVGRPITASSDPARAAHEIAAELR